MCGEQLMVGEPAEWPGTLRRSVEICVAASRAGVVELSILGAAQNYSESWLEGLKPSTSGINLLGPCMGGDGSKESPCMVIMVIVTVNNPSIPLSFFFPSKLR